MKLAWIREPAPRWDADKARILGAAPPGTFKLAPLPSGDLIPGEWWRVEQDGAVAGYGWMDTTWGDAEVLLAVDPAARQQGIGGFILDQLEKEAATRGLNYLYNVVRPDHPERERLTRWLEQRRFTRADDDRLMRRVRDAARGTS